VSDSVKGTYQLSSQAAEGQYRMAAFWQYKGRFERAIASYQQAIELQPDFIPGYLNLGFLLDQCDRSNQSTQLYRQAIELGATESWLPFHLEELLIKQGEFADLEKHFGPSLTSELPIVANADKTQPAHILLYTNCPGTYGAEQASHLLMCELVTQGYRVSCVQSKADHHLIDQRKAVGIEHIWLEGDAHSFLYAVANVPEAVHLFKTARPDLIIFADGEPTANLGASQAAARLGIPFIKVVHCVNTAWADQFSAYLHLLPPIYHAAKAVVTVSQANLQLMRDCYRLPHDVGEVIYCGCQQSYFTQLDPAAKVSVRRRLRRSLDIPLDATVVITTARLAESKGHQHQIEAMKRLKKRPVWESLCFVWAGSGQTEPALKAQVEALGIAESVKFLGDRSDVCDLLEAADIFVLPSHFEGLPISIMEAMAKGVAVAASDISGIPEGLGDTGKLLSDPNIDPDQTADELAETIELWALQPELRAVTAAAGQQRAAKLFQQSRMLNEYIRLISKVLIEG